MKTVKAHLLETNVLAGVRSRGLLDILKDEKLKALMTEVDYVTIQDGETLIHWNNPSEHVYIVVKGLLQAAIRMETGEGKSEETVVGEIGPGEPAGEMQLLTGGSHNAHVYAIEDSELLKFNKDSFEKLMVQSPRLVRRMAAVSRRRLRRNLLISLLTKFFGSIERDDLNYLGKNAAWIFLKRGEPLCRQGDEGDSLAILMSGRLLTVVEGEDGKERVVGEVSQGELVGEMSFLTKEPRSATVYALRDSLLARLAYTTIEQVINRYPQVMVHTARTIVARLSKTIRSPSASRLMTSIAVIHTSKRDSAKEFIEQLNTALAEYTPTLHLNSERLDSLIGISGIAQTTESSAYNSRLVTALDEQSTKDHMMIYESDQTMTPWSERCMQQADRILILVMANEDPRPGELESRLLGGESGITAASKTLIILHHRDEKLPSDTDKWLSYRQVENHHHIRLGVKEDYQRLARILTGNAVGLVLGGGGARALAHQGIIRAIQEAGIPIDMIGGTSVGSLMAALFAQGWDYETRMRICKRFFVENNPVRDYTLPIFSMVLGRRLEGFIQSTFKDTNIEDLWINYFCVSSNLSKAEVVVHRNGPLWKATRTSIAIPGVLPPVVRDGDLLVDGAMLNNVPGDIMQDLCKGKVIAVNVSAKSDFAVEIENMPTPWEHIRNQALPSKRALRIPTILDILTRSTMLGSLSKADEVRKSVDLYLEPPIDEFGLMEFTALEKIVQIGYEYGQKQIEEWLKTL